MRLCLVASLYPPDVLGGAEVYVSALARQLAERHEVSVITTQPYAGSGSLRPRLALDGRVKVYRFFPLNLYHLSRRPSGWLPKAAWSGVDFYNWHSRLVVGRLLAHIQPDLVHTHNLRGLSLSIWDAVRQRRLPLVHTLHDFHLLCRSSLLWHSASGVCDGHRGLCRAYRPVMRRLADSKPRLVLSPSRYVLQRHLEAGLFTRSQSLVQPIAVAQSVGGASGPAGPAGPLRVLFIGAVGEHKGAPQLIEAFRLMADPLARLELAGTGPAAEMARCRALAGADARITFLGFVAGDEKEQAFQRASLVAVPSIWPDNYPVAILESFARGKPVLGTRVGGLPELIKPEMNGLLVEPGSVAALGAALQRLADEPGLLARMHEHLAGAPGVQSIIQHALQLSECYGAILA